MTKEQTIFQKMSARMTDEIFMPILKNELVRQQRRANIAIVVAYVLGAMLGLSVGASIFN